MSLPDWRRYDYDFDPAGVTGPAWVLRLAGRNRRVLELGCGSGTISRYLSEHNGCWITGIEIDPAQAALAERYCQQVLVADLERADLATLLAGAHFETIVAADVLEHLREPWTCLRRLRPVLEPDGYLIACLPHAGHNGLVAHLLGGNFEYRDSGLLDHSHLRFFTCASIAALFQNCGYLIDDWQNYEVAAEQTEFAADWQGLTTSQRTLLSARPDGEVYQYVVKAVVNPHWQAATSGPGETGAAQPDGANEPTAYRDAFLQAHALLTERERQLAEYQQAFADARALLQTRDAELAAARQRLDWWHPLRTAAQKLRHLLYP